MKDKVDTGDDGAVIVGVGASAGGLEAFQDLFSRLGEDHRMALVLVQHLDPDHESLLRELLVKRTRTPVHTIEDGMAAQPGNIYLIPPGKSLEISAGLLRLSEFETPRGQRRPIDRFFQSLAEDAGERAVAIVLSGTGSDGADGIKAIKAAGGLVFAQDPAQAKYDGMPNSAIRTGAVDLTLSTDEMIDVLADYFDRREGLEPAIESDREFLDKVFKHVRYHTGHDFSQYKTSTLMRRLTVRMSVLGETAPNAYLKRLISDREEAHRLIRDVLINVTRFFRDETAWESLRGQVLPEILKNRGQDEEVRIWVPGCSTGQEAYTLAILMAEEMQRTSTNAPVVVFGTDIDDDALATARRGIYPNTIADEVPPQYLETYFTTTPEGFEVGKTLRGLVRFSQQSLIKDPPFSKLDLISCRNVTIYFDSKLQALATSVFHYALRPEGYLFLGMSENPLALPDHFVDVDPVNRIFRRNAAAPRPLNLPLGRMPRAASRPDEARAPLTTSEARREAVRDAIVARHVPPYVVVDAAGQCVHASDGAERYLKLRPGDQRFDISSLIHPDLAGAIRRFLGRAPAEAGRIAESRFRGEIDGETADLRITSETLASGDRFFVFHEAAVRPRREADVVLQPASGGDDTYVRELERDLEEARQTIRTTVEELETSNEELKSSNEEMMSMNEELQSANEELSTINDELQSKVAELNRANADVSGFVASTSLATVFLDDDLAIRRFTPKARSYFRFVESDTGRPLEDIAADVPAEKIAEACRRALETDEIAELEISTGDGRQHLICRVVPARLEPGNSAGVVFTLIDITDLRDYARQLEAARAEAQRRLAEVEELYNVSPIAMALLDREMRYIRVNPKLAEMKGERVADLVGRQLGDTAPALRDTLEAPIRTVLAGGEAALGIEFSGEAAGEDTPRLWIADVYPLRQQDEIVAVGLNIRDVTHQKETEAELRRVMLELQHRVKNMLSNVKALMNRARRDDRDPALVLKTLSDRIDSLSRTQSLLTAENWRSTSIRKLVEPELVDVYGGDALRVSGPDIRLNARASLGLGLAIHELATNAAKYGALGHENGHLDVRWMRIDEGAGDTIRIVWTESLPEPVSPPERTGFGTTLIRSTIEGSLDGSFVQDWSSGGLRAVIEIPYERATRAEVVNFGKA